MGLVYLQLREYDSALIYLQRADTSDPEIFYAKGVARYSSTLDDPNNRMRAIGDIERAFVARVSNHFIDVDFKNDIINENKQYKYIKKKYGY